MNMDDEIRGLRKRISELEHALTFESQEKKYLLNSLRDDFAKAALTGLVARGSVANIPNTAYWYADLMLEARKENKQ